MKLYKYTCGLDEKFSPAEDDQDAYNRRTEVDPTFHFVGVRIDEVVLPGFMITITPEEGKTAATSDDDFDTMERAHLVEWLKANNVEYVPQWGDTRLRETAQAAAKELKTDE